MAAKIIVVTSGKGGVGKSTTTAAIGAALASRGQRVAVVDFDIGLSKLDLMLGSERRVVFDLIDVIEGRANTAQAMFEHKTIKGLFLLAASPKHNKDALAPEGVRKVIDGLRERFDWVICDSPAGIEHGAEMAMVHADIAIVVANPEVPSIRDCDRIIGLLDSCTERAIRGEPVEKHLLVTRYVQSRTDKGEMLPIDEIEKILGIQAIGVIPESPEIVNSSNFGAPVTIHSPKSAPSLAYVDVARRLMGETVEMKIPTDKKGFFGSLMSRRAA